MFIEFIKMIDGVKELNFPDKLFLTLSFRTLEPEYQKIFLEQLKSDPKLLETLIQNYARQKHFLETGDDEGYYQFQKEEEKKLKELAENFWEEERQKQIKNLKNKINS